MPFPSISDKWPFRFLRLALEVSTWSKDPSTKVGCVITDCQNRVRSLGFNGLPADISDTCERLDDRAQRLALTIHAEENAILFATGPLLNAHVFCTHFPCAQCAARLIQVGVAQVHYLCQPEYESRWHLDVAMTEEILKEAGVKLFAYSPLELKA